MERPKDLLLERIVELEGWKTDALNAVSRVLELEARTLQDLLLERIVELEGWKTDALNAINRVLELEARIEKAAIRFSAIVQTNDPESGLHNPEGCRCGLVAKEGLRILRGEE